MKKKVGIWMVLTLVLTILISTVSYASPATSYTWTFNSKGRWTKTQDAYLPQLTLVELGLSAPEDLFVDLDNNLYIVDTGNQRIVKYSIEGNEVVQIIGAGELQKPRGVYVTSDGNIYVADAKAEAIFRYDAGGTLLETFKRPTETAFGKTPFKPMKISVDTKKNMYIIGEGVLNGVIHLSNSGKFLGYFASNKVTLNLMQELQDTFFTDEQMANLTSRVPITITNLFVDQENIVYSTTIGSLADQHLAKHNTAGKNVYSDTESPSDLIDIYVDHNGIVYTASLSGNIWIYSADGQFLHSFGGFYGEEDVSGLFNNLASIAVDNDGKIWALDSVTSYVQSFKPTAYATTIYSALEAFKMGAYDEAETLWLEVLGKNQMLRLAHQGIGKVYLYTQRYDLAMNHLKIANSKYFYSQAYWEVRNIWLQERLAMLLIGFILLMILRQVLNYADKKKGIYEPLHRFKRRLKSNRFMNDLFFIGDFFKHPIDSFYDLKIGIRGSFLSAHLIFISFFVVYIHSSFGRGFLFRPVAIEDVDFTALSIGFVAILMLFVMTNYLVSSIQDGDGSIGDIYKMTAYAMTPMILGIISVTLVSYVLSYNEEFLIKLIEFVVPIWSGINLIIGLQEVHQYSTREAIKSVIISLAFMVTIAIVILIVVIMSEQVFDFIEVIVREVVRNVTG